MFLLSAKIDFCTFVTNTIANIQILFLGFIKSATEVSEVSTLRFLLLFINSDTELHFLLLIFIKMYKIYFLFYQFFLVSNQEIQKQATFNNLFTCLSQLYELRI